MPSPPVPRVPKRKWIAGLDTDLSLFAILPLSLLLPLGSWLLPRGSWLLALGSWLLALWLVALGCWLVARHRFLYTCTCCVYCIPVHVVHVVYTCVSIHFSQGGGSTKHIYLFPKQSFSCGWILTYSPNKASAAEGFLLVFYRIALFVYDFPSSSGHLGYLRVPKPSCQ